MWRANMIRSVLALGVLIAISTPGNGARVQHWKARHFSFPRSQGADPRFPPVLQDQTPLLRGFPERGNHNGRVHNSAALTPARDGHTPPPAHRAPAAKRAEV